MSLEFRIAGRVLERQSGLGVAGLLVRAYDKDLLFDDLLGTATTGADGTFELRYSQSDFRELFERRPDVYLSVYEQPGRFVLHTKDAIRWNAGTDETFEVKVDRRQLTTKPQPAPNEVQSSLGLPRTAMTLEQSEAFVVPRIPGFATGGIPGAPALPRQMRFVALPPGGDVLRVDVEPGEPVRIAATGLPLPAQAPIPDRGLEPRTGQPLAPLPPMTAPDPCYYAARERYPRSLVQHVRTEEVGPVLIAALQVTPVQFDPAEKVYLFYPDLRWTVSFDLEKASRTPLQRQIGELYAEDLQNVLAATRVDVSDQIRWPAMWIEQVPHLIITDNFRWPEKVIQADGTSRAPLPADRITDAAMGDLVTEFQRLADWRTSQGMRSRVVSISDIVAGTFGDFTENGFARDLQEVIRNFLKVAHAQWGMSYTLLGGDIGILPMRVLAAPGVNESYVGRTAGNPPEEGKCFFAQSQSVVKMRPKFQPAPEHPLSTYRGVRIPYNPNASPSQPGWYFTTEEDFNKVSFFGSLLDFLNDDPFTRLDASTPTKFVIVEGPDGIIDDEYYWVIDENSIPSDFYYASLVGPGYSVPGQHDFDTNGNGLYGQWFWNGTAEQSHDGIDFNSDVWVGRVPAKTAGQVKAYVDKVLAYEDPLDPSYLTQVVYAADYWGRLHVWRNPDPAKKLVEGNFDHFAGMTESYLRLELDVTMLMAAIDVPWPGIEIHGIPGYRLVAQTGSARTSIPYNPDADGTVAAWYFATDATFANQSANPTRFVKVVGPEAEINPDFFFFDPLQVELGAVEKETLRTMMGEWFPQFDQVQRHYADTFELAAPPPIVPLEQPTLRAALNAGAHFVSLTGHGWTGGCCGVDAVNQPDFTNAGKYFIAFADSCSTARPDDVFESLGEVSVLDEKGGAVAYVGNTRYSWIGTGDNYEQVFWCLLRSTGRVGPAAGHRLASDGVSSIWTTYAQTLYGDPALRVWEKVPQTLSVELLDAVDGLTTVEVMLSGALLHGARVTVTGDGVFLSKKTSPQGRVSFAVPREARGKRLQLTVTSREGQTHRAVIG